MTQQPTDAEAGEFDGRPICRECGRDLSLPGVPVDDRIEYHPDCVGLDDVRESNLRVFIHKAETPMRGHDADGACCRLAAAGPQTPRETSTP